MLLAASGESLQGNH